MNYDWFLRCYHQECSVEILPIILAAMRNIGISSRHEFNSLNIHFKEEEKAHIKNCKKTATKVFILCLVVYLFQVSFPNKY